jgi:hypothetical protein
VKEWRGSEIMNDIRYVYMQGKGKDFDFHFFAGPYRDGESLENAKCYIQNQGRIFSIETYKTDTILWRESAFQKERDSPC